MTAQLDPRCSDLDNPDRDVRQVAAVALGTQAHPDSLGFLVVHVVNDPDPFVRETLTWACTQYGADALAALGTALDAGDLDEVGRAQALHVISKIGAPGSAAQVLAYLDDPSPAVAGQAQWALAQIGDPVAVRPLIARLGTGTAEQRNALTTALTPFGSGAVAGLASALQSADSRVRQHAADVLCFVGDPAARPAVPALARAVTDPDRSVRVAALMALAEQDTQVARDSVLRATDSNDRQVRTLANRLVS